MSADARPVLVVTGAASGIGLAAAERMARTMTVVLADLDGGKAESAAAGLRERGAQALGVEVDVTSAASVRAMVAAVHREAGPVHALFSNAGVALHNPVDQVGAAEWDLMMDTHLKGAFLCSQAVLPDMLERGKGVIVFMASDYSAKGMVAGAAYAAAKTGLLSLTRTLAAEFVARGVRINALGPGPIETPLLQGGRKDEAWRSWKSQRAELVPMGRIGTPGDVAGVLEFLVSDRSSYMTGQLVHVNGGQITP